MRKYKERKKERAEVVVGLEFDPRLHKSCKELDQIYE
jgi:hypothetical protein